MGKQKQRDSKRLALKVKHHVRNITQGPRLKKRWLSFIKDAQEIKQF